MFATGPNLFETARDRSPTISDDASSRCSAPEPDFGGELGVSGRVLTAVTGTVEI